MATRIGVIGECMIELSQKDHATTRNFGGDTLNTAVYLARLLPNASEAFSVHYVSALGTDPFSQEMIEVWQTERVQTDLVQRMPDKMPGLYAIVTDPDGERHFYYWRNDAAAKFWLQTPEASVVCKALESFQYLYLSGISIAILDADSLQRLLTLLQHVRSKGGQVIFDNNYRPRLWKNLQAAQEAYRQILALTDIAFLTIDDEFALWGEEPVAQVIQRTQTYGVKEIVIKRSVDSCVIHSPQGETEVPAISLRKEQVIDTTAAGDSFSAGYLAARLQGANPAAAAKQGHLLASTVIQHRGAIIAPEFMPDI